MFPHDFPFDPTYGYTDQTLRQVEPPAVPGDFAAFWRERYAAARAVPVALASRPSDNFDSKHVAVEEVEFDALGLGGEEPRRLGGWLVTPKRVAPVRAEVVGHGYGGRDAPELHPSDPPAVRLFLCMRGFHRSASPDLPDTADRHVLHGIASRQTYLHLGCAADLWAAVTALQTRFPEFASRTDYRGSSFGGGIGALALPWDARIRRAALDVPSFGHHPLRLTLPCTGSGEAVRRYHQRGHDVMPVLQYFDAATAARFISQPTLVSCARFDPAVPPPGQVAVYNAIPGERKRLVMRDGGHFEYPALIEQCRRRDALIAAWFAA